MNWKLIFIGIIGLFVSSNTFGDTDAGNTGLAFLKIGAGGRASGMGEAFTAIANDASATYWNPAGLAHLQQGEFVFTHNKWLQDISHEFLAVSFQLGKNAFGISFISNNIDGIEYRLQPTSEPLGLIDARDIMLGFSFAREFRSNFKWGITVKYL